MGRGLMRLLKQNLSDDFSSSPLLLLFSCTFEIKFKYISGTNIMRKLCVYVFSVPQA